MKKLLLVLLLCSAAYGQLRVPSLQITDKLADTTFLYKTSVYVDTGLIYKRLKVGYWMVDSATGRDTGKVAVRDTFKGHLQGRADTSSRADSVYINSAYRIGGAYKEGDTIKTLGNAWKFGNNAGVLNHSFSAGDYCGYGAAGNGLNFLYGDSAGINSVDLTNAVGIGDGALKRSNRAWEGCAIGPLAMAETYRCANVNALGAQAGYFDSTSTNNNLFGDYVAMYVKNCNNNNLLNDYAGRRAYSMNFSNGFGVYALDSATGSYKNAFGWAAGQKDTNEHVFMFGKSVKSTKDSQAIFSGDIKYLTLGGTDTMEISNATDTTYFNTTAAIISFNKPIATKFVHSFQYFSATACTIAVAVANTPYPITNAGKNLYTVGESDYVTSQGDSAIIQVEGDYKIFYTFVLSGANGNDWRIYTQDNGVSHAGGISGTTTGTSNFSNMSGFTYFYAHVGDHLRWVISNVSDPASTNDPIIRDGKVLIEKMPE